MSEYFVGKDVGTKLTLVEGSAFGDKPERGSIQGFQSI